MPTYRFHEVYYIPLNNTKSILNLGTITILFRILVLRKSRNKKLIFTVSTLYLNTFEKKINGHNTLVSIWLSSIFFFIEKMR